MSREADLERDVEVLKKNMKEAEEIEKRTEELMKRLREMKESEESRRVRKEEEVIWGEEEMYEEMGRLCTEMPLGMHVDRQSRIVAAEVNFVSSMSRAMGSRIHVGLQESQRWNGQPHHRPQHQPHPHISEVFGSPESTEEDYYGGPLSEVFGSPESTEEDYHGGPLSEVFGSPEWSQTDNVQMSMFPLSKGHQQTELAAVTFAATAAAAEVVTGTSFFPAVPSKDVVEAPTSSAGAASAAVPSAARATGSTVFPTASVGGAFRAPASSTVATSPMESAAEPAISGTVPSAASVKGAVGGRESSAGAVPSDAEAEAAPSTGGTAAPVESVAWADRKFASTAGSAGDRRVASIFGEKGESTHPFDPGTVFPLEARYRTESNSSSSNSTSNSISNQDPWGDTTFVVELLRPFDSGKGCQRDARRKRAVLGVDLPSDRGKT